MGSPFRRAARYGNRLGPSRSAMGFPTCSASRTHFRRSIVAGAVQFLCEPFAKFGWLPAGWCDRGRDGSPRDHNFTIAVGGSAPHPIESLPDWRHLRACQSAVRIGTGNRRDRPFLPGGKCSGTFPVSQRSQLRWRRGDRPESLMKRSSGPPSYRFLASSFAMARCCASLCSGHAGIRAVIHGDELQAPGDAAVMGRTPPGNVGDRRTTQLQATIRLPGNPGDEEARAVATVLM